MAVLVAVLVAVLAFWCWWLAVVVVAEIVVLWSM